MHTHFLPRLLSAAIPTDFAAWPYVDDLFDYTQILDPDRTLAPLPPDRWGTEVAIVGAGVAGMVAAYELLRMGLRPVVFEASGRVGGRGWSRPFTEDGAPSAAFAEMGAMRFPVCDRVVSYYARDRFGLETIPYPEPGSVPTLISFANEVHRWMPGEPLPGPLQSLADDWRGFLMPLLERIYAPWQQNDLEQVRQIWQGYIGQYRNTSLFGAIAKGIPTWTPRDFGLFGATGAGSGGIGALYDVGFLELLRIFIRFGQAEHLLFRDGINELTRHFHDRAVATPGGRRVSLRDLDAVRFGSAVTRIAAGASGNPVVTFTDPAGGAPVTREYPALIVATSLRAMETLGITFAPEPSAPLLAEPVKSAIRSLRLMNGSKLFIRTATKFWRDDHTMPQNILTDEFPSNALALDYPQTDNGVVLISYAWGPDASKLQDRDSRARFALCRSALAAIDPAFAARLDPLGGEILHIDWETEPYFNGGFKLDYPGQDASTQAAYYQYLSVLDPATDRGIYLAGESVAWQGGWTESALHTGLNAACAVAHRLGAPCPAVSPLRQNPGQYTY